MSAEYGVPKTSNFLWTYADRIRERVGRTWYKDPDHLAEMQHIQAHYVPRYHAVDWSWGIDEETGTFPSTAYDDK